MDMKVSVGLHVCQASATVKFQNWCYEQPDLETFGGQANILAFSWLLGIDMGQGDLNNVHRKKTLTQSQTSSLEVVGSRNGHTRTISPIRVSVRKFVSETI